jgi:21S rRNA (GM2251-2'-O)-methyltransferase
MWKLHRPAFLASNATVHLACDAHVLLHPPQYSNRAPWNHTMRTITASSVASNQRDRYGGGGSKRRFQPRHPSTAATTPSLFKRQDKREARDREVEYNQKHKNYDEDDADKESPSTSYKAAAAPTQHASSLKEAWIDDVVYGVSPVLAALQAGRRTVHTLYLQDGSTDASRRKDGKALHAATTLARSLGAKVRYASKHDLNMVSDNRPHQGIVLDASPLQFESLEELEPAALATTSSSGHVPPLWLCLDEVADPQNFGAILRSAYFLGASGVLTCHRNSAPLTATVSKASAGAMELMTVHSARNLPRTLAAAREAGWVVLGAAAGSGAVDCREWQIDRPTVLVVGNEGRGLRTMVRQQCDALVRVDGGGVGGGKKRGVISTTMAGEDGSGGVDSLNVSVATAILLHELLGGK